VSKLYQVKGGAFFGHTVDYSKFEATAGNNHNSIMVCKSDTMYLYYYCSFVYADLGSCSGGCTQPRSASSSYYHQTYATDHRVGFRTTGIAAGS